MNKFRGQLFGYRRKEVDQYFEKLHNDQQMLLATKTAELEDIMNKNASMMSEIKQLMNTLAMYISQERQLLHPLYMKVGIADDIIRQAEEQASAIKIKATRELSTQKERLTYLQNMVSRVSGDLEDLHKKLEIIAVPKGYVRFRDGVCTDE